MLREHASVCGCIVCDVACARRHFLLITLTVMSTITALIYASVLPRHLTIERAVGLGLSVLALVALMCTAMSDPGIFRFLIIFHRFKMSFMALGSFW